VVAEESARTSRLAQIVNANIEFFWRGQLGRTEIDGVDLLRLDANGQIAEVWVYIAPLVALGAFAAGAGPSVAARRGRVRGLVVRVMTVPLRPMFRVIDALASRLA
jgi:hypothetical protein